MGERFPEFDDWLKDSENDDEFRRKWHEEHPLPDEDEMFDDENLKKRTSRKTKYEEPEPPPLTIVRRTEPIGRNDPCPCGSGKKFKKCCYRKNQAEEETDSSHASAMSGVIPGKSKPNSPSARWPCTAPMTRSRPRSWLASSNEMEPSRSWNAGWGQTSRTVPKYKRQMQEFFQKHGVKSVVATDQNIGCPHEEGEDFPLGEDCPFCPFWKGKQGSATERSEGLPIESTRLWLLTL